MSEGVAKRAKTMPTDDVNEKVIIYTMGMRVPKDVTKLVCDPSVIEMTANLYGCSKLKEVVLNEGLINIRGDAFIGCSSLRCIRFPSTVTKIGYYAFADCIKLKEVVLNEGLPSIGTRAFMGCTSLTSIALPSTVTEVGYGAFRDCNNLTEIILNEGLQKIAEEAFRRCESLECARFPSISKRVKNLLQAGYSEIQDKIDNVQHFEWNGNDLLVSAEAIREGYWCDNWAVSKGQLECILSWVSYYELKGATSTIELAMWKAKIGETRAVTLDERNACRVDVPGPAKDAILQYLKHGEDLGNAEDGDDDEGFSSSSDYVSSDEDEESSHEDEEE